jgi:PcRGLX-like protein central beta sandwich domain
MTFRKIAWLFLSLFWFSMLLNSPRASALELKLSVREMWGQGGRRHVSGGVPLLPGQAKDAADLCLARKDAAGNLVAVPAQFRVLARYWRGDNSIRWVLVDFMASLGNTQTLTFYLTDKKLSAAKAPAQLTVKQTEESIVIDSGPAQFTIDRKKFAFLSKVVVDGLELIETPAQGGSVVEDTFGNKYLSSAGTTSVKVIEQGPMRVCVRARGHHRSAQEGKGYKPGMYMFDVFMNFYPGSRAISVDYVVCNNPSRSTGAPTFEDASLIMKFKNGSGGFTAYGSAPINGLVKGGEISLYQDSNGAETWQRCQGYTGRGPGGANFPKGATVSFKGFKLLRRIDGKEEVLSSGERSRGVFAAGNGSGGVVVHTRDFWQQFPKAVGVNAAGNIRFGAFPRESKVPHFIEDGSGKGHELYILFYAKGKPCGYPAPAGGRPYPHVFADMWEYPVYPRPDLAHIAATGALTDLGPSSVPTSFHLKTSMGGTDYGMPIRNRRQFMTDKYWGNGYGWQVFGSTWQAFGGHSTKGARQPMKEDFFLYRWYWTGLKNWLTLGNRRSRNFRDVRNYRIEGVNPFGPGGWKVFSKSFNSEQYTKRPQPSNPELKKYSAGKYYRNHWELPNPSHMTMDLLYDRYLLFGDQRAFENMRIIAGHGGNYAAYTKPKVHRLSGWSWRAIERYWELTGDKEAQACLKDVIKNYKVMTGKGPIWAFNDKKKHGSVWFSQIHSRAAAMTALHTRDKDALEFLKTHAVGKESEGKYFCTMFSVLYHLTGEDKYKKAVLGDGDGSNLLKVCTNGDFPATSHWLLMQKPNPLK